MSSGSPGRPSTAGWCCGGIRTLDLRVREQSRTAGEIAKFLDKQAAVKKVYYPGLPGHQGHALAARQQTGFGAMLSLELQDPSSIENFVNALTGPEKLFCLAESLGGYESLIAHPATMTHASMTPEERRLAGVSDALLRISIGLETAGDLKKAFKTAFASLGKTKKGK